MKVLMVLVAVFVLGVLLTALKWRRMGPVWQSIAAGTLGGILLAVPATVGVAALVPKHTNDFSLILLPIGAFYATPVLGLVIGIIVGLIRASCAKEDEQQQRQSSFPVVEDKANDKGLHM